MQKILVVQRDGLGDSKVEAVAELRPDLELHVINLERPFEVLIDDPEAHFPDDLEDWLDWAELVLDHLYHPDLSDHLVRRCGAHQVPVIAAGRRIPGADTPTTCCTLTRRSRFGPYGESFGAPEFEAEIAAGKITRLNVLRGAPCGATWKAAQDVTGLEISEALHRIGLVTQFHCLAKANPNIFLTNPLHVAGDVHIAALRKALPAETLDPEAADQVQGNAEHDQRRRGGDDE